MFVVFECCVHNITDGLKLVPSEANAGELYQFVLLMPTNTQPFFKTYNKCLGIVVLMIVVVLSDYHNKCCALRLVRSIPRKRQRHANLVNVKVIDEKKHSTFYNQPSMNISVFTII